MRSGTSRPTSRGMRRPTSAATRLRISAAALLVNVMARIEPGWAPRAAISQAMRRVSTRVLPDPAPATTSSWPTGWRHGVALGVVEVLEQRLRPGRCAVRSWDARGRAGGGLLGHGERQRHRRPSVRSGDDRDGRRIAAAGDPRRATTAGWNSCASTPRAARRPTSRCAGRSPRPPPRGCSRPATSCRRCGSSPPTWGSPPTPSPAPIASSRPTASSRRTDVAARSSPPVASVTRTPATPRWRTCARRATAGLSLEEAQRLVETTWLR